MPALRYAVLDEQGNTLNVILIDDPYPPNYWPGYGRYVVPLPNQPDPVLPVQKAIPNTKTTFEVLEVKPEKEMAIGDKMDLEKGTVTKFEPVAIAEPIAEEPVVKDGK